ncbi:MAG: hypothetical protein AABW56_03130, partial [Nanoarchaeota archaeon]
PSIDIGKQHEETKEEKLYDSMSEDDKQKILDFIKEKTDDVDNEIKELPVTPKEEIKEPEKKIEEIKNKQPLPGHMSSDLNRNSGLKGSKWIGKNRPKSNPV